MSFNMFIVDQCSRSRHYMKSRKVYIVKVGIIVARMKSVELMNSS